MGVQVRKGRDGREEVMVSCDHPGCNKKAVRKKEVSWYNRKNGHTTDTKRDPQRPFPYWRKVFSNNRYKNPFHLYGGSWPEGVKAYCDNHNHLYEETREPDATQLSLFPEPTQITLFED